MIGAIPFDGRREAPAAARRTETLCTSCHDSQHWLTQRGCAFGLRRSRAGSSWRDRRALSPWRRDGEEMTGWWLISTWR